MEQGPGAVDPDAVHRHARGAVRRASRQAVLAESDAAPASNELPTVARALLLPPSTHRKDGASDPEHDPRSELRERRGRRGRPM
jgi:hypothetical protein